MSTASALAPSVAPIVNRARGRTVRCGPSLTRRPSRVTVPEKSHPFARLLFSELRRQNCTYAELEFCSGVLVTTIKSYRSEKNPSLLSTEATLGALGWSLVPTPDPSMLSAEEREAIEALAGRLASNEIFAAAVRAAADFPPFSAEVRAEIPSRRRPRNQESAPCS